MTREKANPYLATLDREKLIEDLNTERFRRRYSWRDVASETGLSPSTFSRMIQHGRTLEADALVSLLQWLGRPLTDYVLSGDES